MSRFVRPSLAAGVVAVLTACSGPSGGPEQEGYGPLAVVEDTGGGRSDALGGTGTVAVTAHCVELDIRGKRRLLVWRSIDVRWDPAARAVVFSPEGGDAVVIGDGATVTVGGEDLSTSDPAAGTPGAGIRWLAGPDDRCSPDGFVVHSVRTAG